MMLEKPNYRHLFSGLYVILCRKMKNKKILIVVSVAVFAVLILAIYLFSEKSKTSNTKISGDLQRTAEEPSSQMSLKELIAKNIPQKCEMTYSDGAVSTSVEMWIKGEKFKQVTVMESPELGSKKMGAVSDGEYIYSWDEETRQGSKILIEETQETNIDAENVQVSQNVDWEARFDYKCSPAAISDADLTPPSDVSFMDMNAEIQKAQDQLENMNLQGLIEDIPQIEE
ncbi:MAG: hypothetical protein US75_C0010G0021 [Candidatus Woesebacteria bacterium GW2011_GWC1_38_13]|uniref:Uncharacterized protein n=4 Tax=Candidatus Woeseibacteriota TaxID=1752722 RepID=A0A0G0KVE2_9BACT|nr:MAG: hypothetical protein US75_C0010G0021 [Candidatus Woesebacteria bacterium GW2011_GWC1_38_13]KKQ76670.1 MAG: hypothetical protein US97_C0001G0018 [Microgenomates group bacterium GW2011_GWF1_38_5]KKQ83633.1 MAG: hypothetical protein UT06_C0019G0013 [Candidatus Woesebacteria bacterium GW2011_GWA1_38_8]